MIYRNDKFIEFTRVLKGNWPLFFNLKRSEKLNLVFINFRFTFKPEKTEK